MPRNPKQIEQEEIALFLNRPMFMINRSVVIFKELQPFVDWLNQLPDNTPDMKFDLANVNEDGRAFLVPEFDTLDAGDRWIKRNADYLFDLMLEEWCTEPDWWPVERSFKVFKKWFSWEIFSCPFDLLEEEISKEEC